MFSSTLAKVDQAWQSDRSASMERFPVSENPQSKGGRNRAAALTPEQRREIAKQGARARWFQPALPADGKIPKAVALGVLQLGDIPCAVLDDQDNTRVLTQTGFLRAIGRAGTPPSPGQDHLANLPAFLRARNLEPFISNDLISSSTSILFDTDQLGGARGKYALGFKAELLPAVCWVYQEAKMAGKLLPSQLHVAEACAVLLKGLTNVAINSLVDEATGFQDIRVKDALIRLLEKYVSKDAFPWVRTFDDEFYKCMFRLHGYPYTPGSVKRPMIFAKRTEDIYNRLAPGVREELQSLVKRGPSGRPSEKLFQHLTENEGYKALIDLIKTAKIVMKLSNDPKDYERKLDRLHPRFGDTIPLPLPE
ncbi:MAG: P63C domain-containing protein [Roseiarcus sp.]